MSFWFNPTTNEPRIGRIAAVAAITIALLFTGACMATPQYRLYRANVEKEALVRQARAERDASVLQAEAEVIRSEGVAEANRIIAESIDEQYIRWLYVDQLDQIDASQVIYIPTEGGLPILEATRLGSGE